MIGGEAAFWLLMGIIVVLLAMAAVLAWLPPAATKIDDALYDGGDE